MKERPLAATLDCHLHSSRSDGVLSPTDLVDLAAREGVRVRALTDHDTLEGIAEARAAVARHPGMRLIPGVELSCDVPGTEVHMLGLFVDPEHAPLLTALERMRRTRVSRGERIVEALRGLGAPIEWARVREIAGEASIGRPHIAAALIEAGHVANIDEAFARYLGRNSPAYVERERLLPEDSIALIRDAGGLPIFAHPPFTDGYVPRAEAMAAAGLWGIECYYRFYTPETVEALTALAARLGLIASGGSDYHGAGRDHEVLPGGFEFPARAAEAFLEATSAAGARIPEAAR